MGLKSRNKGKSGEREIAAIIRDVTGVDVRRRVRQHDGDSDLEGIKGWSVEVKRHAKAGRADIEMWWKQTVEQSKLTGYVPVLFYRRDFDQWRAVWPLAVQMGVQTADMWSAYQWTVEGTPEAWAAVFRERNGNGNY